MAASKQTVQQVADTMIRHMGKRKALNMMSEILATVDGNLSYSTTMANIYKVIEKTVEPLPTMKELNRDEEGEPDYRLGGVNAMAKKTTPPLKRITAAFVTLYAIVAARKNKYEKQQQLMRDQVLPLLQAGKKCPPGPFILQLTEPECPTWSWKDEYIKLLAQRLFDNTSKASLAKAEKQAEKWQKRTLAPRPTINVIVNTKWKGEKPEAEQ